MKWLFVLLMPIFVFAVPEMRAIASENTQVSGEQDLIGPPNPSELAGKQLSHSADLLMTTIYQNCDAPSTFIDFDDSQRLLGASLGGTSSRSIISDRIKVLNSHPYLTCESKEQTERRLHSDGQCPNVCAMPPLYAYGKGRNNQRGPISESLDPFDVVPNKNPYYGMDCSAFVTRVTMAAGLNLIPGGETRDYGSADFLQFGRAEPIQRDCFDVVDFSKTQMAAGDMMAWDGHVMMISRAGLDPFGLSQFKDLKSCDQTWNYDLSKLDFDIVQSANYATEGPIGVSKVRAADFYRQGQGVNIGRLHRYIKKACKAKFGAKCPQRDAVCARVEKVCKQSPRSCAGEKARCRDVQIGCYGGKLGDDSGTVSILLRHVGTRHPECVKSGGRPEIKGETCSGECK